MNEPSNVDGYKIGIKNEKYSVKLKLYEYEENLFNKVLTVLNNLPEENILEDTKDKLRFRTIRNASSVFIYCPIENIEVGTEYHLVWDNIDKGIKISNADITDYEFFDIDDSNIELIDNGDNHKTFILNEKTDDMTYLKLEIQNTVEIGKCGFENMIITKDYDKLQNFINNISLNCDLYTNNPNPANDTSGFILTSKTK